MASMQNIRGTDNTALIPKYWEKKYLKDQHEKDPLKPFYGTNSIVVTDYDLKAKKGDTVVVPIAGLPSGAGVTDDGDYDSDIGSIEVYDFPVVVHEHGRALGLRGKMSEKSPSFNARTLLMDSLTSWRAMFNARAVIDALSGMDLHTLGGNVLGSAVAASGQGLATVGTVGIIGCVNKVSNHALAASGDTALRYYCGGQSGSLNVSNRIANIKVPTAVTAVNYTMGPAVIEDLRKMARKTVVSSGANAGTLLDPIQPISVNGKMLYVLLVSLDQGKSIRQSTSWKNGHYYADIRGMENSIFSGQIGVWDGVMVIETDLLHQRSGDPAILQSLSGKSWMDASVSGTSDFPLGSSVSVHRALFLGQKAVAWAWGESPEYKEFYADHAKTKWAARVCSIYGVRKIIKSSSSDGATSIVGMEDTAKGCIIADTCVT